jgi:hypothetical protein
MTVGHALQDVLQLGKWLDVVELCGGDERADGCPSDEGAAAGVISCFQRNSPRSAIP